MVKTEMDDIITDDIKDIELEKEGKEPQENIVFVTDEEQAAVLDDPVRLHILQIIREGIDDTITTERTDENGDRIIRVRDVKRHALSVPEIVKLSGACCGKEYEVTKNQVYYHLPTLVEHGYIVKFGTVKIGKREIDYWRRTAKGFVLTKGAWVGSTGPLAKKMGPYVDTMLETFDLDVNDSEKAKLVELLTENTVMQGKWRTKIAKLVKGDVADKKVLDLYETLLHYYSMGSKEYVDNVMEIRKIIFPKDSTI